MFPYNALESQQDLPWWTGLVRGAPFQLDGFMEPGVVGHMVRDFVFGTPFNLSRQKF